MLHSMTGYGVGESKSSGFECRVELRSINARFLDFSLRIPQFLTKFEFDREYQSEPLSSPLS